LCKEKGGGGQDGLAEALEDGGYAVETFAAGVHPRKDNVKLVSDAFLPVEGWDCHKCACKHPLCDMAQANPSMRYID